jgi:hypothetical protein
MQDFSEYLILLIYSYPIHNPIFKAHPKARRVIENAWGLLKTRFQCTRRTLKVKKPAAAAVIVKCCAILHNFLILVRDDWIADAEDADADDNEVEDEDEDAENVPPNNNAANAWLNRLTILNHSFLQANNL